MSSTTDCKDEVSVNKKSESFFFGLLFVAGYMSNAIYPSFVNAITNIPRLMHVSIGSLATAEFLAFGIAILLGGKFIPFHKLRTGVGLALCTHILSAYGMNALPDHLLIVSRLVYGFASGLLVAIAYVYIAKSKLPGKTVAVYTTGLMVTGVLWSLIAPRLIAPYLGFEAYFLFLTSFSLVALLLIWICPPAMSRKVSSVPDNRADRPISIAPILILMSVGAWALFMTIFWVYADPIAQNLSGDLVKNWLTVSLVCQILGAACSAVFVEKISAFKVLICGLCLSIIQIAAILSGVGGESFVIWTGIYGFLGYFLVAFYIRALALTDITNKSVVYFPGVQMLISSIGPMVVAQLVSETDLHAILTIDLCAVIVAPLLLIGGILCYRKSFGAPQHAH